MLDAGQNIDADILVAVLVLFKRLWCNDVYEMFTDGSLQIFVVPQLIAIFRLAGGSYDERYQRLGELHQTLMEHIIEQLVNHSHNKSKSFNRTSQLFHQSCVSFFF